MLKKQSILLVDDDEFAQNFVRAVLQRAGFQVSCAEDVGTALECHEHGQFDVVITDWNLPDGTGGQLLDSLKSRNDTLPVILITGETQENPAQLKDQPHRFEAILHKPFSPRILETTVRESIKA